MKRISKAFLRINPKLTNFARDLRKNQTDAEKLLWHNLRNRQLENIKFKRQYSIGPYIVDFISLEKRLIIELDGGQHNEDENIIKDQARTEFLEKEGFKVLRFWNNDVLVNTENVLEEIIQSFSPSPRPSP